MLAFVSLAGLTIFAKLPVLALFMTIVLMFCRLPAQSYFSCLKRSGKQEQRHIENSKRIVAVITFGAFFVLGSSVPQFSDHHSQAFVSPEPSASVFLVFSSELSSMASSTFGSSESLSSGVIPSLVASVAAASSMALAFRVNRVTVNLVIHRHDIVYRIGIVSSFII